MEICGAVHNNNNNNNNNNDFLLKLENLRVPTSKLKD